MPTTLKKNFYNDRAQLTVPSGISEPCVNPTRKNAHNTNRHIFSPHQRPSLKVKEVMKGQNICSHIL